MRKRKETNNMAKVTVIPSTIDSLTKAPLFSLEKKRVAAYARVSTDSDEQYTSYEAQVQFYTEYINNHEDWKFVKVFADEGLTGTMIKNRKGFLEMMEAAKKKEIDLIITKSISRFARNTLDTISKIRELKTLGVEVFFEKENLSTFDSKSEFILTIMASIAQEESRSISQNVTWGKRVGFQKGKFSIPFKRFLGFKRGANGEIEIDQPEADLVREIYRLFLVEGMTCCGISRNLMNRGITTVTGSKKWSKNSVLSILTNEKYKGDALLQKGYVKDYLEHRTVKNNGELPQYYVENSHPAIINKAEWDMVQYELKRRDQLGEYYSSSDLFASKLICEDCGGIFGRKVWHAGTKYESWIYRCNKKFDKKEKDHICETPHLKEEEVISKYLKAYNQVMANKQKVIEDLKEVIVLLTDTDRLDEEISECIDEMRVVEELVQKLIAEKAKSPESDNEFEKRYESFNKRFDSLKRKLEATKEEKTLKISKKAKMESVVAYLEKEPDSIVQWNRETWMMTVEFAKVHRDKTITFKFYSGQEVRV